MLTGKVEYPYLSIAQPMSTGKTLSPRVPHTISAAVEEESL
jgi:hypothetical protein